MNYKLSLGNQYLETLWYNVIKDEKHRINTVQTLRMIDKTKAFMFYSNEIILL